nr:uncharacterized protein LOC111510197 [Leptinotarsa decemlineata]XP_023021862.1 uncharacterized protein LOC111510197 [Leptinotarsa decemlineata]
MVCKLVTLAIILYSFNGSDGIIHSNPRSFGKPPKYFDPEYTINKVSLTQRGYIQFLRYITEVPPLTEYTFCIWMRSHNLTHNHPILSYSKHEEERRIRVWISPYGKNVNLEILNQQVFEVPVNLVEGHWYHICQSWSSNQGAWHLYFNGKLKSSGIFPKLRGAIIQGGGDIVVGQEYTDFDKGLEDGIEGDIFGFNFVLSSSSNYFKQANFISKKQYEPPRRTNSYGGLSYEKHQQLYPISSVGPELTTESLGQDTTTSNQVQLDEVPDVVSYLGAPANRDPKGLLDIFRNTFDFFDEEPTKIKVVQVLKPKRQTFYNPLQRSSPSRVSNDISEVRKPLGLLLVEMSFDCGFKKGAPLNGKGVLINWTKSPVRVFGGAILKSVPPFC